MAMVYNAGEVLDMAIRIEQNAVAFYSKAADLKQRETRVDFLLNLATMEKTHEEEFRSLREELTEDERQEAPYDPYGEAEAYLRALADGHGGEGSPRAADEITPGTPLRKILKTAVALEKQTIGFYGRLVKWVPERLGADKVQRILQEEQAHVQSLQSELQALTADH